MKYWAVLQYFYNGTWTYINYYNISFDQTRFYRIVVTLSRYQDLSEQEICLVTTTFYLRCLDHVVNWLWFCTTKMLSYS